MNGGHAGSTKKEAEVEPIYPPVPWWGLVCGGPGWPPTISADSMFRTQYKRQGNLSKLRSQPGAGPALKPDEPIFLHEASSRLAHTWVNETSPISSASVSILGRLRVIRKGRKEAEGCRQGTVLSDTIPHRPLFRKPHPKAGHPRPVMVNHGGWTSLASRAPVANRKQRNDSS